MNLLKDSDNYGEGRRCGQSQCHTARDKRTASSSSLIARQIAEKAGFTIKECSTSFKELWTPETTKIATKILV